MLFWSRTVCSSWVPRCLIWNLYLIFWFLSPAFLIWAGWKKMYSLEFFKTGIFNCKFMNMKMWNLKVKGENRLLKIWQIEFRGKKIRYLILNMNIRCYDMLAAWNRSLRTLPITNLSHFCAYIPGFRKANIFLLVWQACSNGITLVRRLLVF